MAQIQIRNNFDEPLSLINIRLTLGKNKTNIDDAYDDRFTDYAGNTAWPNPLPSKTGYTLQVNVTNVNGTYENAFYNTDNFNNDIKIKLARTSLQDLRVDGLYFNAGNKRIHLKGNTDFLLYKRFLDGEDIEPICIQRNLLGSRYVRIIGMVDSFAHWHPQDYGNAYYDKYPIFQDLLNKRFGLYPYFCVFADTQIVMPNEQEQIDHFNRMGQIVKWGELVNEQGQHQNSVNRERFSKPSNGIWSSGSFGGNIPPNPPHWDFIDFHSSRNYPSGVKDLNNVDYFDNQGKSRLDLNKPIGMGEPIKFGPGSETNTRIALEAGNAIMGNSPYVSFHCQQGVMSEIFTGNTLDCANSFFGD